jgi:flagellar biosynthesis/type III secretory pathway M-ring protein FliF/YscJ
VVEHHADEVLAGGALLWEIPVTGGTKVMMATSEFGSSSLWWIWLIVGAVLLIGAAALIFAVIDSRKRSKKAVDDAAAQSVAGDAGNGETQPE